MPPEAFVTVDELKLLYGDGNKDGVLPIIAISFCWLTPAHPDPAGQQLASVAAMFVDQMRLYRFAEMGVFWDWCSLHQKDPALWTPACTKPDAQLATAAEREEKRRYEASRTNADRYAEAMWVQVPSPTGTKNKCLGVFWPSPMDPASRGYVARG